MVNNLVMEFVDDDPSLTIVNDDPLDVYELIIESYSSCTPEKSV